MKHIKLFEQFVNESSTTSILPSKLEKHKSYDYIVRVDKADGGDIHAKCLILDIDDKTVLVLDSDYFRLKKKENQEDVYKITLDSIKKEGIDDAMLDDFVYVFFIRNGKIETETGFSVEFIEQLKENVELNESKKPKDLSFFEVQFGLAHMLKKGVIEENGCDRILDAINTNRIKIEDLKKIIGGDKADAFVDEIIALNKESE